MTFVEMIECTRTSATKRTIYFRAILLILALTMVPTAAELWGVQFRTKPHELFDFEGFYLAGQLVWRGAIEQAYHFVTLWQLQQSVYNTTSAQPWTYPPQFDLVVALFALVPQGLAYCIFIIGTLAAYLATLRRVASENAIPVLILLIPVIVITIRLGQNGFLTGTLIGLTCLGLQAGRSWAGLPLGLMIIKPHLAVAFAAYTLVNRRWGTVLVAAATVAVTSVLATVLLGPDVWTAFFNGVQEAGIILDRGFYPLFRMISAYAVVRSLGVSALLANAAQIFVAILALGSVVLASRQFSARRALGITAIATLLISPYEYDYDLLTLGIGLGLLMPDLASLGTDRERLALYASIPLLGIFNIAQTIFASASDPNAVGGEDMHLLSLGGLVLIAILILTWRILLRGHEMPAGRVGIPVTGTTYVHANASSSAPST
jgi:Glycosyltransferase family 87